MAIAFVSATVLAAQWPAATTVTFTSVDAGSAAERLLLALVTTDRAGATGLSSATYNGVAMSSLAGSVDPVNGHDFRLFYLTDPASSTNNLVVTTSDNNALVKAFVVVYSGVDQTTPLTSPTNRATSVSGANPISFSQTTNSGETAAYIGYCNDTGGGAFFSPGSGLSERFDNTKHFLEDGAASATSTTIAFTPGGTSSHGGASMGIIASGGVAGVPKTSKLTLMGVG